MPLNMSQRVSKLWAASFNLLAACEEACKHLPEDKQKELEHAINVFKLTVNKIRNTKER